MREDQETTDVCHIAKLPYELRDRIFQYALQQKGTIGLQTPTWDNGSAFTQPLFAVCRTLRDEALEAFYKSNAFLWSVHRPRKPGARPTSDPSSYPLQLEAGTEHHRLTCSLPWHYPRLMQDLRHLFINVSLPSHQDPVAWSTTFPQELQALVTALDRGVRLKSLHITVLTAQWKSGGPLPEPYREVLGILAQLRVSGIVKVQVVPRGTEGRCAASVYSLLLGEKIKA